MICNIHSINPPTNYDYLCLIFHSITSSGCWLSRRCSSAVSKPTSFQKYLYNGDCFDYWWFRYVLQRAFGTTQPPNLPLNLHFSHPPLNLLRIHLLLCPSPAFNGPAPEVEVNGGDLRLDGCPQPPAHIGHDHVEFHARNFIRSRFTEICGTNFCDLRIVELHFLAGVTQLKSRIIVAAVFVVDQPELPAIVNIVFGKQVIVAGNSGQWVS